MKIKLSQRAAQQLQDIRTYLDEHTPEYTIMVVSGLLEKIASLGTFPTRGHIVPNMIDEPIKVREIFYLSYRIGYIVKDTEIFIIAVTHQKQKRKRYKNQDD